MGRGMAANLLDKSFAGSQGAWGAEAARKGERGAFVVYDAFPSALNQFLSSHTNAFAGRDVLPASSPAGATRLASTIVTMLPSSKEVEEVYLGENGIREALEGMSDEKRRETLLIDCTTGDREEAIRVAKEMESLGVKMVDAPVSGGVVGAEKGTLSFMVGGSEEACVRFSFHRFGPRCLRRAPQQLRPGATFPPEDGRAVHPLRRLRQRIVRLARHLALAVTDEAREAGLLRSATSSSRLLASPV